MLSVCCLELFIGSLFMFRVKFISLTRLRTSQVFHHVMPSCLSSTFKCGPTLSLPTYSAQHTFSSLATLDWFQLPPYSPLPTGLYLCCSFSLAFWSEGLSQHRMPTGPTGAWYTRNNTGFGARPLAHVFVLPSIYPAIQKILVKAFLSFLHLKLTSPDCLPWASRCTLGINHAPENHSFRMHAYFSLFRCCIAPWAGPIRTASSSLQSDCLSYQASSWPLATLDMACLLVWIVVE